MLTIVNAQYLPNGKAYYTNFKLGTQTEDEDPHHRKRRDLQGQRSRTQGHVMRLTGAGPYVEKETVMKTPKL